jgi:hypothetical protein
MADTPLAAALESIPAEDWCRNWPARRTIMLRRTSKRVKEVVDKMRQPAVVRLNRSFWDDVCNGTVKAKLQFVLRQVAAMPGWCHITTLELPGCHMTGQDAERLAAVLVQCPALAHLDLSGNQNFRAAGADRLAGVLVQCAVLTHVDLTNNEIGSVGAGSLARVLGQCVALVHLDLGVNGIGDAGADRLAGVLAQCTALAHLNLRYNQIGRAGAERLAGVLTQCPALAHLHLGYNFIGAVEAQRLRASWRGQASGLVLYEEDEDWEDEEGEQDDYEDEEGDEDDYEDEDEEGEEDDYADAHTTIRFFLAARDG